MSLCFHFFMGVLLIVFQTASPYHQIFCRCYDMVVPFILYLGIFRPTLECIIIIITLGFIMDSFSGGYFGLYGVTYLWLFIGTKWIMQYVHVGDRFLLPIMTASGILLENCIFFGAFIILKPTLVTPEAMLNIILFQVLLGIFTGPFLLKGFYIIHSSVISFPRD